MVHPLAPSLSSEPEVSALARCHAAISPLIYLTSAHVRNPGCRYVGVLVNRVQINLATPLAHSLGLGSPWADHLGRNVGDRRPGSRDSAAAVQGQSLATGPGTGSVSQSCMVAYASDIVIHLFTPTDRH